MRYGGYFSAWETRLKRGKDEIQITKVRSPIWTISKMVVLMKNKEMEQFMCDYFLEGDEIAVDARWLQSKLMELESMKHAIKTLSHQNELLQSLSLLKDYDCPKYRLNVKG